MVRRSNGIAVLAAVSVACARYEPAPGYETLARTPPPPECFDRPATITAVSTAANVHRPADIPAIAGVVQNESSRAVQGAAVELLGDSTLLARTDSTGRFAFPVVPPGRYRVRVRRVGYNILAAELSRADSAPEEYRIVVPTRVFDGPCAAAVMVRKPWWKFW